MKVMTIVAWALAGILLIGAGVLGALYAQQSGQAAGLRDAVQQIASAAGLTQVAPESLRDAAGVSTAVQQVQAAIQGTQQELATTKESLTAAQAETTTAKGDAATLKQGLEEQTGKAETAAKELAAKVEEVAAAKAAGEKAVQEAKAAAEKQKAEADAAMEALKAQAAEETARLQAEIESMKSQTVAAPEGAEAQEGAPAAEGEEAVAGPEAEGDLQVIGSSEMFSLVRYSPEKQTLFFNLQDGQTLTYREVPRETYDQLLGAKDTMDMFYRFKIQGVYKSIPPDGPVVRKYWRAERYRPVRTEVRGPVLPPPAVAAPVEEGTAPEAAPAEATVEPAAGK